MTEEQAAQIIEELPDDMTLTEALEYIQRVAKAYEGASDTNIAQRIAATRKEIERLKRLPPSNTRHRAGSGNPRRADMIARHERQLKILQEQQAREDTTT